MADLNPAGLATASRLNSSVNVACNLGADSGEVGMISRFEGNCVFFMNILRGTLSPIRMSMKTGLAQTSST